MSRSRFAGWFDHRPSTVRVESVHMWLTSHYERTGRCEYCGRTDRRTEWASAGHRYTRNRADWFEFCRPCHRKFDEHGVKVRPYAIGNKWAVGLKRDPETQRRNVLRRWRPDV